MAALVHSNLTGVSLSGSVPTVIVDRSPVSRAGLAQLLQTGRFRTIAQVSRVEDIPERLFRGCNGRLILIGADGGAELLQIKSLKEQHIDARVVLLSDGLDPRQLLSFLEAGVDGILLKNEISSEALIRALELVLLGEAIVPFRIIEGLKDQLRQERSELGAIPSYRPIQQPGRPDHEVKQKEADVHLSSREQAILRHLMRGASNKLIARELNIADGTIKVHVRSLLRKIRASNRTQAAVWGHKYLAGGHSPDATHIPTNASENARTGVWGPACLAPDRRGSHEFLEARRLLEPVSSASTDDTAAQSDQMPRT